MRAVAFSVSHSCLIVHVLAVVVVTRVSFLFSLLDFSNGFDKSSGSSATGRFRRGSLRLRLLGFCSPAHLPWVIGGPNAWVGEVHRQVSVLFACAVPCPLCPMRGALLLSSEVDPTAGSVALLGRAARNHPIAPHIDRRWLVTCIRV